MEHFLLHPDFYSQPIRLDKVEIECPAKVLATFFDSYQLVEVRQHLGDLLRTAMTTDNALYQEPRERDAEIEFVEQIEKMVDAAYAAFKVHSSS